MIDSLSDRSWIERIPDSSEFEAASNAKYNQKRAALAAQVAGLHQHTCYAARYLGSGTIFSFIFQCLADNLRKNDKFTGNFEAQRKRFPVKRHVSFLILPSISLCLISFFTKCDKRIVISKNYRFSEIVNSWFWAHQRGYDVKRFSV